MYGYGYGFYGFDRTYILLIIGMLLSLAASAKLKSTFAKYRRIRSASGLTGAEAAARILRAAGITDVQIQAIPGSLTDHYDPRTKTVSLSQDIYGQTSLAAVGVAAHECGHAIQHAVHYAPLEMRSAIVPVANLGSSLSWPLFLIGLLAGIRPLTTAGIVLFSLAVLFQLVTLPVELNASSRALRMLEGTGILGVSETKGARKVLTAAALTYVAALAASILQLLRLLILAEEGEMMTNGINTREMILEILLKIDEEGEHSHIAIRDALSKYQFLPKQDRAFITRVCEGTLEYRILIDYIIDSFSKISVDKMKPPIREILRSAVYQLKFMDRVPDSAVCNEAVKLAQRKGFYNLKPFVTEYSGLFHVSWISWNILPEKEIWYVFSL